MASVRPITIIFLITCATSGVWSAQYLGKYIGKLSELHHGVSGEVYAVDAKTLYLKDFTYDGQGPAAYFYASSTKNANTAGFRLLDENGSPEVIRRYRKEGVTLSLPEGRTLNNIKIFYVWCEEFEVNFGDVKIPRNFDYPKPQKIETLKGVHGISSDNIVIVDAQTLLVPNLSYDGEAPDAKFWVGRGLKPSPQGIRVPDENGKEIPLRRYDRKTVVLTLPGDLTVFDIGHFGIWCEAFTVDFGHVQIPQNLNVPPSLKMLGVSPQSKLNCEVLHDDLAFEVRWAVAGDSIVLQLVAKLDEREYMSFGVSGDDTKTDMIGGDVVVAWVDKKTLRGTAQDYYLESKSQCSGPTGSCPDNRFKDKTNNIRLLNAAMVNGYSIVTYQRPLKPSDEFDRQIHTNRTQAIIWAIGPLNQRDEVSFHSHYLKHNQLLNFGRTPKWNCPTPEGEQPPMKAVATTTTTTTIKPRNSERRRGNGSRVRRPPTPAPVAKRDAWEIPPIQCYEPEDGVFYAQMGPTGGKRGYPAITGHVGWGISWYINGLLIPEINVVRGKTYTFVVEGGFDPEVPAKYHPFYITDDSVGGYEYKTEEEKKNIRIFAGGIAAKDGTVKPSGTGRLCHWTQQGEKEADDFDSFGAYQRSLELKCDQGEPGVIQWTPDKDTPDTVYYQCFTHRYLGWKINVHDSCDIQPSGSAPEPVVVQAPEDLDESPSILIETRVKPNDIEVNADKQDFTSQLSELKHYYTEEQDLNNFKPSPIVSVELTQVTTTSPKLMEKITKNYNLPPPRKPVKIMRRPQTFRRPLPPNKAKIMYKKPMYRPVQRPAIKRPLPFIVLKPGMSKTTTTPSPPQVVVSHVEISPEHNKEEFFNLKPAENTGFHPESVKIEGGFTPMLTKPEFEDRISEPELEYESEIGVINHEMSPYFEPVFVPSPVDKRNKQKYHKRRYIKKIIVKHPRSLDSEEPESAAAERVDSYYLPPQGILPKNAEPQQRSDIDLEAPVDSPPDVVVTYDGRKVSGASLTARIGSDRSILQRGSKAEEFIKARPQFAPFKGELPPLDPKILNKNVAGVISRELDGPPVTKLRAVRQKRSPHHTPEHTAEQRRQNTTQSDKGAGNLATSSIIPLAICLLVKFLVN